MGNVINHTLPLGMFETYTYDPNGNILSKTDFNDVTTTYEYGVCCSRLLGKYYADGSSTIYTYTANGLGDTITDVRGVTDSDYDVRGRLIRVTHPDGSVIEYTYDAAGNRTSVTIPSGTTAYTFDELNRLETVTDPNGGITSYTYDNLGNRASVTYPNGTVALYTYDDLNRLTLLENRRSDNSLISSYAYTLGPAGNRLSVTEHNGRVVDYAYDVLYRLTSEAVSDPDLGNETTDYTYDAFGNRLTKTDSIGTIVYTYDENDRMIIEAGPGQTLIYTYDDNGNTLSISDGMSVINYIYDSENQLLQVQNSSSTSAYVYDAEGIRVASSINGITTNYLIDKNRPYSQVLEEYDNTGALAISYTYGDDLISQSRSSVTSYFHYDGQTSTRHLSDLNQNITDTYTYDAFGFLTNNTGSTINNYLYTGEQYDPNGRFYYLRARYYNQSIGRFITADSIEGFDYFPETLHKYYYAKNNPLTYVDPSGKMFLIEAFLILREQSKERNKEAEIKIKSGRKVIKVLKCSVGVAYFKRITKDFVGHHSYQKSMGGAEKQDLVYMAQNTHNMIHSLQNIFLKKAGFDHAYISKKAWERIYEKNPAKKYAVGKVLLKVARLVDRKCKLKGVLYKQTRRELRKAGIPI